jgi:gliding motility-associated-like protein
MLLLLLGASGVNAQCVTVTPLMLANSSPADGSTNDVIQVTVTQGGVPLVGQLVDFSVGGAIYGYLTDASGQVQFKFASNVVQGIPFTISVPGQVPCSPIPQQDFVFVLAPPNLNPPPGAINPSFFITIANDAANDGTDTNSVEVHITDGTNNFPQGYPVTFTVTSATPASATAKLNMTTVSTITTAVQQNGSVTLPITDLTAGNVTIEASLVYNGVTYSFPVAQEQTVTFLNNTPDPAASNYTTIIASAPDDGTDTAVVQVHLVAPGGGPVAGNTTVYFTVTSAGPASTSAMLNLTTTTTFSEQIGNFLVDGNTIDLPITDLKAGSVTITASVMVGGVLVPINGSPQTVTFVTGPPVINQPTNPSFFTTLVNNQAADGSSQDVVEVFLADQSGSGVSNYPVTFTITSNNPASANALFDPPPANTPTSTTVTVNTSATGSPSGAGYIVLPLTDLKTGSVTITATFVFNGVTYTIPVDQTVNFVAGPPVPSNPSTPVPPGGGGGGGGSGTGPSNPSDPSGPGAGFTYLTMTYNDVPADGVSVDTATAYITDAQGRALSGVAVIFTLHTGGPANSGALFQPQAEIQDTVYTNANGFAAMAISDTIPGDAWVDASIMFGGVLTVINGSSAIAHFTQAADVRNPNTQLIVVVYEALADGSSTTAVKAHVVDASGSPVANATVQFSIDSGTATIVTTQPLQTDANGDATIYLTSNTVGNVLVTATVGGKQIIFGSPARVYFAGINIYVPRAFSPNNDGTNDLLKPILVGIQTFHYFTVYNRWGNIIFTTTDPNQGWDGTFKGVPQPVETYLWIAEGIDVNGKKIVAKGMTSLVR